MRIHRLQTLQRLPISIEEAWDFFSSPKNLRQITPHWLDFRMTNEAPEEMRPGTILSYTIRPVPLINVQWVTEITHIKKPNFFVDEQRFGPFKMWHHEHYFRPHMGGVEVEDIVQYGLYLGPIGTLAHDLYVRRRLHEIFTFRAQVLEQRFGRFESEAKYENRKQQRPAGPSKPQGPITLKDIYGE
ncbi:MAG: SRPBCC family protein [Rhodothermales bacterium]